MKLTNDLEAGQIQSTADVAPSAHTLFCGGCFEHSVYRPLPSYPVFLDFLIFFLPTSLLLSGNFYTQSALELRNSEIKYLLFGTIK